MNDAALALRWTTDAAAEFKREVNTDLIPCNRAAKEISVAHERAALGHFATC
jgi:hypothetical protein